MFSIKYFKDLSENQLEIIIKEHFNHWVKYNPLLQIENTSFKFNKLYCGVELPFGIALFCDDKLVGFCVLKKENLKKHLDISPWISDVMIFEKYRHKGYGRKLIEYAEKVLKNLGYKKIYVWTDQAPDFYKKLGFIYEKQVEKNEGGFGELYYKLI